MPAEITLPVYVRVGGSGAQWGELTVEVTDGTVREADMRRQLASFLREAADHLETMPEGGTEVPNASADR
ncbi:hypothetical protein ACIOG7_10410 [Streptomyces sp. NPDC087894]|uniref:hypothetical protein n=1 Tax=Streptomyces sp. NPDC087894 TaxID=3365816 RepID=UPI0037F6FAC3